ncbi:MAG TPA: hypothetical protein DCY06_14390 [Bacteroidetes bacterium]|nr:hypothetical protein [Bacteroidota bacterium]
MMDEKKGKNNEKYFKDWIEDEKGKRIYKKKITGKFGWYAVYEKAVDNNEKTISFKQNVYDENDKLREVHQKYPIDTGHKKL